MKPQENGGHTFSIPFETWWEIEMLSFSFEAIRICFSHLILYRVRPVPSAVWLAVAVGEAQGALWQTHLGYDGEVLLH